MYKYKISIYALLQCGRWWAVLGRGAAVRCLALPVGRSARRPVALATSGYAASTSRGVEGHLLLPPLGKSVVFFVFVFVIFSFHAWGSFFFLSPCCMVHFKGPWFMVLVPGPFHKSLVHCIGPWFIPNVPGSLYRFLDHSTGPWYIPQVPGSFRKSLVHCIGPWLIS